MGHLGKIMRNLKPRAGCGNICFLTQIFFSSPPPLFINSLSCSKIDLLLLLLGKKKNSSQKYDLLKQTFYLSIHLFIYKKNKPFRKRLQPVPFPFSLNDYLEPVSPSPILCLDWEFGVCECLSPQFQGRMWLFPSECPLGFWSKRW